MGQVSNRIKYFLIGFLFLLGNLSTYCQNTDPTPLKNIIENIEIQHNVSISYDPKIIEGININPPTEKFSLDGYLSYLTANTSIVFTKISERYISAVLKSESEIRCGKIIDASSGEALTGATILISLHQFSTKSNDYGLFFIPSTTENGTVTISYVGYETAVLSIQQLTSNCTSIQLFPKVTELDYVVLNTIFTKGIVKDPDGSIVVRTDNFGLLPGQVENDVLQIVLYI